MVDVYSRSYCRVEFSFKIENIFLVFILSFQGYAQVTSSAAEGGGRRPLPVPPPTAAEVAQASTSHSEETPGRPMGEAAKQRATEPHLFTHLSLARASMKIWCIFKSYTAIKWRELLVVDEPSPLACVAHNIFGESPVQFDSQNMKSDLQLTLEDESGTKDHEPMFKTC